MAMIDNPSPCFQYYLLGQCHSDCRYGHNYHLSEDQLVELRKACKKKVCPGLNRSTYNSPEKFYAEHRPDYSSALDDPCLLGEGCIYAHKSPQGSSNLKRKRSQCGFKGTKKHAACI